MHLTSHTLPVLCYFFFSPLPGTVTRTQAQQLRAPAERGYIRHEPQTAGSDRDGDVAGNTINSNVRLNEINIRAFRHFRKMFPEVTGESWIKTEDGYTVSFSENSRRTQAHFDLRGGFLYTVQYCAGRDIPVTLATLLMRQYPDYTIGVVTQMTNGEKTLWIAKIQNPSSIKTITVCDGKMDLVEDLVNGG